MTVYDENWEVIEDPDFNKGYIETTSREVYHMWVTDKGEISHEEVVAEYPETGGKDIRIVIDSPEEGHWETFETSSNEQIYNFEDYIDAGWPHDIPIVDYQRGDVYHLFTEEELEKNLEQKRQYELAEQQRVENEQLVEAMPDLLCAMYEENLQLKDTIDQQEEVLCAMYEESIQVKDDSAIAYAEATRPY